MMVPQALQSYLKDLALSPKLSWLAPWQMKQKALFKELPFPSFRSEAYRHTPLHRFMKALSESSLAQDKGERYSSGRPGFFPKMQNTYSVLPATYELGYDGAPQVGLRLFSTLAEKEREIVKSYVEHPYSSAQDPFVALNGAAMQEGIWLDIPPHTVVKTPIYLHHILGTSSRGLVHPYLLVTVGEKANVTLLETVSGTQKLWVNGVKKIFLEKEGLLAHYELHTEGGSVQRYMGHVAVTQKKKSDYTHHMIAAEGETVRHTLGVLLKEAESQAALYGLYTAKGQQHFEHHVEVNHEAPHTRSHTFYRGTAEEQALGLFYGNIGVAPQAQQTEAQQLHNGWILSSGARIYAHPSLAIGADQVKCTHGATLQKVDEEALNYLRMRGISSSEAGKMMMHAFLAKGVDHIGHLPTRAYVMKKMSIPSRSGGRS